MGVTTTLVLAGVHTPIDRYAGSLAPRDGVRLLRPNPSSPDDLGAALVDALAPGVPQPSQEWVVEATDDLVRSILYSRGPVVVDNLPAWVAARLTNAQLWSQPDDARQAITDATLELAALLAALPFDAVVLSREPALMDAASAPVDRTLQDAVALANTILANHTERGVLLIGGRAVDLSTFPALPY